MARVRKQGTLLVLAILFGTSGVIRLGLGTSAAIALVPGARAAETSDVAATDALDDSPMPPVDDLDVLLAALAQREARNDAREAELVAREERLYERQARVAQTEADAHALLDALSEAEESLRATVSLAETAAQDDLDRLTKVYEAMKPKEAAQLFETMDPVFSAGFLGRMKPQVAASIMGQITPESAYSISAILAGRNARVEGNH